MRDLAELYPERFNSKTNGVTPRRWLRLANPWLAEAIDDVIGGEWITDLPRLRDLRPLADAPQLQRAFLAAKRAAKEHFAEWLRSQSGVEVDVETVFDCQIKRIHEYKRQLLNVLRIVTLYNRLRANPRLQVVPRTFFFSGKAAPAGHADDTLPVGRTRGTEGHSHRSGADGAALLRRSPGCRPCASAGRRVPERASCVWTARCGPRIRMD